MTIKRNAEFFRAQCNVSKSVSLSLAVLFKLTFLMTRFTSSSMITKIFNDSEYSYSSISDKSAAESLKKKTYFKSLTLSRDSCFKWLSLSRMIKMTVSIKNLFLTHLTSFYRLAESSAIFFIICLWVLRIDLLSILAF